MKVSYQFYPPPLIPPACGGSIVIIHSNIGLLPRDNLVILFAHLAPS